MLLKLEKIGKIYDSGDILTVGIRGIDLAFDYNEFVTIEGESVRYRNSVGSSGRRRRRNEGKGPEKRN